jgi:hypothetical protein
LDARKPVARQNSDRHSNQRVGRYAPTWSVPV